MKKQLLIIPAIALLASCGGTQTQNTGTASDTTANKIDSVPAATTTETPAPEKPKPPEPYSVDNLSGKFVDYSKPVLITRKNDLQGLCEYCRYDGEDRIIEYGCVTGQYDYESYIRMFKINYNGEKIDSIQCKEVYLNLVEDKQDLIFKKDVSIFDQITGDGIGFLFEADKNVKDLDPKSIASMRKYADSKNDILWRQYRLMYDFSEINKWKTEKRDDQGRLTYSEITLDVEYTDTYKINYTYEDGIIKKVVKLKTKGEGEEGPFTSDWNYTLTEKYLRTDNEIQ